MPLNEVGRRYAEKLFLGSSEAIAKQYQQEVVAVRKDFASRNMTKSGAYISAHTRAIVNHIRLLTEARADAFLKAYEKSDLPFDDAGLGEVTAWVVEFCGHQQDNAVHAIGRVEQEVFGAQAVPPELDKAVVGDIQREITGIISRAKRNLSIERDEAVLAAGSQQIGHAPQGSGAPPCPIVPPAVEKAGTIRGAGVAEGERATPHRYYWRFCKRFGNEWYQTWRQELFASVAVALAAYLFTAGNDPAAWKTFRIALVSTTLTLALFALWHLFRTPWLLHRETVSAQELSHHWRFGVLGVGVIVGLLVVAYFSVLYLSAIRSAPVTIRIAPPPAPPVESSQRNKEKAPKLRLASSLGRLNGSVFKEDEKGNVEMPVLQLTNEGDLAVQQASIRIYFSEAVANIGSVYYQPAPSDDRGLPFELYVGGAIQINPGETWTLPPLTLRRAVQSEKPISARLKVFYGTLTPVQATFRIEKRK